MSVDSLVRRLPYHPTKVERIVYDIDNLNFAVPSLGNFDVGKLGPDSVLRIHGVLPITYQRREYNIPVQLFLPYTYPTHPPAVFVVPTPEMSIQDGHPHVGLDGVVFHPYLHGWSVASSSLFELAHILQVEFSKKPPVVARPPSSYQSIPPPRYTTTSSQSSSLPSVSSVYGADAASFTIGPPPKYGGGFQYQTTSSSAQNQNNIMVNMANSRPNSIASQNRPTIENEADKRRRVTRKLQMQMTEYLRNVRVEFEKEAEMEMNFKASSAKMDETLAALEAQKSNIRQATQELIEKEKRTLEWLSENENDSVNPDLDTPSFEELEKLVTGADTYSNQLFECVSQSAAIEDTLYCLDKALVQGGILDLKSFLKEVRNLSRELFFQQALALKVMTAQQQAMPAVSNGASNTNTSTTTSSLPPPPSYPSVNRR